MSYYKKGFKIYLNFLVFLKPYWKVGAVTGFLMLLSAFLRLPTPLLTRYLIDNILPTRNLAQLNLFSLLLIGLIIVGYTINYIQSYLLIAYRNKIETDLRTLLFAKVMKSRLIEFEKNKTGYMESRISSDIDAVGNLFIETLLNLIMNFLTFLVGLSLCFYLNVELAVVSMVSLPVFVVTFHAFSKQMNKLSRIRQEKWARLRGTTIEYLSQVKIIKAFNGLKEISQFFQKSLSEAIQSKKKIELYNVLSGITIGITGVILPIFVLWYGIRQIIFGHFTLGGFVAFNACLGYLYDPIRSFVSLNINIHASLAAAERIFEVLDFKEETQLFGNKNLESLQSLQLQNVSYYYEEEKRGISNVSIDIKIGEKLAVVGETGKGKSTIARLIIGFDLPQKGELYINGIDYRLFDLLSIRRRIGYVPQEPELMTGSILENITFFSDTYDKSLLSDVIKGCDLEETISRFPDGLKTDVYEKGAGLSGGEKQRIAIARAVLRKPDLLILDEASSAVDPETESRLMEYLMGLSWKPALIMITHRYHYLDRFDAVIELK